MHDPASVLPQLARKLRPVSPPSAWQAPELADLVHRIDLAVRERRAAQADPQLRR